MAVICGLTSLAPFPIRKSEYYISHMLTFGDQNSETGAFFVGIKLVDVARRALWHLFLEILNGFRHR